MSARGRARPRRRPTVAGAVGLVAVAGTAALLTLTAGSSGGPAVAAGDATATTAIDRRDLVEVQTEDGTLGYSDSRPVAGHLAGTITWLPREGAVVRTNTRLYEVDESRVYLLDGAVPAYRALEPGTEGGDVRALERNLRELGMDGAGAMTVDGTWDAGTTAAVKEWQDSHNLEETGTIELGRVVFAPGHRRVSERAVSVGASSGSSAANAGGAGGATTADVMTTTSTQRIVTVALDTTKSSVAKRNARVSVELPSGAIAHGRIVRIATTAQQAMSADGQPEGSPTIRLTIKLSGRAAAIDQAPVTVRLEVSRAKDVLAIPVTALLARSGGRFAVEVVDGDRRRIVPVTTGLFTSGYVAIDGSGLRAGMRVANAAV